MEEIGNGTFEWKIDDVLKYRYMASPYFKLGRWTCFLSFCGRCDHCLASSRDYTFYLAGFNEHDAFSGGEILKLYIVDVFGEEKFVTKQQITNRIFYTRFPLGTIDKGELKRNMAKLIPGGILTVRLSWYENVEQEIQTTADQISNTQVTLTMLDILSEDFTCFFESKENTDCVLKVGDAKFPVHRAILSARSEVFAAMFRHGTSESRSGVVDVQDVEAVILSDFLHYVYSGKVHGLTPNTAVSLHNVAHKYALFELRDFCLDFLKNNLKIENVCDAAILAHSHGEEELERNVSQFLQDKMEEVENSEEWKKLEINKPSLVIKLLRFIVTAYKDKTKQTSSK